MNLRTGWNRFWFTPAAPEDLAVARILFGTALFVFSLTKAFHEWAEIPEFFHGFRARYFPLLGIPVLGTQALIALEWVWRGAILMSAAGLFSRASSLGVCLGSVYLMGLDAPEISGRSYTAGVFVPLILAFSRCGDALSVDAWFRNWRGTPVIPRPDEYGWPGRLICAFLCFIFFGAGIAKVRFGGFPDWMLSETLPQAILRGNYWYASRGRAFSDLGPWILQWGRPAAVAIAVATQWVELLYPLALFWRPIRITVVPAMCALLVGIWLCMGPFFFLTLAAHVFWVPWSRLLPGFSGFPAGAAVTPAMR